MKIDIKAKYAVSSAVVLKAFMDKEFHEKKLAKLGLKKYAVLSHEAKGDDFRIKIERKVPMAPPGIVAKLVPAEATVVSEEKWNRASKTGVVKIETQGIPIDVKCSARFADAGEGCVLTYAFEINARVPLVGGALEKFVGGDMEKKMAEEARTAATLMDAYR